MSPDGALVPTAPLLPEPPSAPLQTSRWDKQERGRSRALQAGDGSLFSESDQGASLSRAVRTAAPAPLAAGSTGIQTLDLSTPAGMGSAYRPGAHGPGSGAGVLKASRAHRRRRDPTTAEPVPRPLP